MSAQTKGRQVVKTANAPEAIGPYSQAIRLGGLLFTSGQIALEPATGKLKDGDVSAQAEQALSNLAAVLEAGGSSLDRVVKATIFLKDMADFAAVNQVYAKCFGVSLPARSCVEVARLPRDAKVEIEAIAAVE
jgi:2-iminobutanoate/2-iminopropanoate deaminase